MLIKKCELNDELIEEIGKFAVLWNLFENEYCDYNATPKKIIEICKYLDVDTEKQAALAEALNSRRLWFDQLYSNFIICDLYSDRRYPKKEEIECIEAFLKQEGNTTCGCLLCVSRIRNNLMHGLKAVEALNEQLDIFIAANSVLESL